MSMEEVRGLSKPAALAAILAITVMPWFQGGRDPVGWMVLIGVGLLGSFILWRNQAVVTVGRIGLFWSGFIAWTALSMFWSVNRYQTFTQLLLYLLIGVIFILARGLSSQRSQAIFTWGYIIVGSLASLAGLIFYIFNSYNRATSTFYLPNPFAAFLIPLILIGLWRFNKSGKIYDAVIVGFNFAVLLLTDSRGAFLAFLAILALGFWLESSLRRNWSKLSLILVGAVVLALSANLLRSHFTHNFNLQGARFKDITSTESNSTSDRIYFVKSALLIWKNYPIGGSGAGTFPTLHPKYQYRVISAGNNVHNFYVQTLAELGVVGLLVLIILIVELALGVLRQIRQDPSKLPYALGLLALLLHAAVDIDSNYPVLWCLAAILAAFCYLPNKSKKGFVAAPALALGISLLMALPAIRLFQNQMKAQFGKEAQQQGDYAKAAGYYYESHVHAPYDPDWISAEGINTFVLAATGTDKANNYDLALKLAETAGKLDPKDGQHDLLRGRVLVQQNKLKEAIVAFQAAISKDPYDQPDYYNDLAAAYLRQNRVAEAGQTITKVLDLYPDSVLSNRNNNQTLMQAVATGYATAAQIAIIQNRTSDAKGDLQKAVKLDPNNLAAGLLLKQLGQ